MPDPGRDLRNAVRSLVRQPRFVLVAVLTLALGFGLNATVFSVVRAALLRPLPYPEPERVLQIANRWEGTPIAGLSPAEFVDYRDVGGAFEALGAYAWGQVTLTGTGEPARFRAAFVSAEVSRAIGVSAALGRWFTADENRSGESVVVLSDGVWRRWFAADPGVLDRSVTLNGASARVIGVLPPGFQLPEDYRDGRTADLFLPLNLTPADVVNRGSHFLGAVGRLAPGVSGAQAEQVLAGIAARFVAAFPDDYPARMAFGVQVRPLEEVVGGNIRQALLLLLGAAALVLLVACTTVANLVLVRLDGRRRELAIRTALGASRRRVLSHVLVECVLIAGLGGILGVLVAWWGSEAFVALDPPGIPRIAEVRLDWAVAAFTGVATAITALLLAAIPGLLAVRAAGGALLRDREGRTVEGAGGRSRRTLVVVQVALALVLLAVAGLFGRSLAALNTVDPGYDVDHVLAARLSLPGTAYASEAEVVGFYEQVEESLAALPGVRAAGAVTNLPLASSLGDLNFRIEGQRVGEGEVSPRADWQAVTPGYFTAMGLRLQSGRFLDERDGVDAPGAVIISRSTAERYWPGEDALGRRFTLGGGAGPGTVTVVGVVEDVRHGSLAEAPTAQMYLPHAQFRFWNGGSVARGLWIVVRSEGADPLGLVSPVRQAIRTLDPLVPVSDIRTMTEVRSASLGRQRLLFVVGSVFGALALLLGALGIYGVVADGVVRRTREIGVRMALGAGSSAVARMVAGEAGRLALAGIALGLLGAALLSKVLQGLLYGVTPLDPATLAAVAALLSGIALLASWLPARRAARIRPMEALRHE